MSVQYITTTSSSSTANLVWPTTGTFGTYMLTSPPARKPSPLEWLDRETEKVCAIARGES